MVVSDVFVQYYSCFLGREFPILSCLERISHFRRLFLSVLSLIFLALCIDSSLCPYNDIFSNAFGPSSLGDRLILEIAEPSEMDRTFISHLLLYLYKLTSFSNTLSFFHQLALSGMYCLPFSYQLLL